VEKGIDKEHNSSYRHNMEANDISLFEGDILRFVYNCPQYVTWFVECIDTTGEEETVKLEALDCLCEPRIVPYDDIILGLEGVADPTVKEATLLSRKEAEYLYGTTNADRCMLQKFADPTPKGELSDLVFTRERSASVISRFVNHPVVGHELGRNYNAKHITFGARYGDKDGSIAGIVDLTYPSAPQLDGQQYIELKRFATHPHRPENTGSWLIAKAIDWARLEAYDHVISYAGVGGNTGVLYRAVGLSDDQYELRQADGSGWAKTEGRDNRSSWEDYERNRYQKQLVGEGCPRHRRENQRQLTEGEETLAAYGSTSGPSTTVSKAKADTLSLHDSDSPVWFARRDMDTESIHATINEYGDQSQGAIGPSDAIFAALCAEGVIAALCLSVPDDISEPVVATGYGTAQSPEANKNTAASLVTRARDWAGLSGYTSLVASPCVGTEFEEALKQCGFDRESAEGVKPRNAATI